MQEKIITGRKYGMAVLLGYLALLAAAVLAIIYGAVRGHVFFVVLGVLYVSLGWIALCGLRILKPQEALVLTLFGKYIGTLKGEGFYYVNPFCSAVNPAANTKLSQSGDVDGAKNGIVIAAGQTSGSIEVAGNKKISLKIMTLNNSRQKINDCLGNPVEIGIAVMWRVVDTAKAVFDVDNYKEYLSLQCDSALRNIVRIYPYDVAPNVDTTGDGVADEGSLRGSSEIVAERIRKEIQQRVDAAGIEVIEARITYLTNCGVRHHRRAQDDRGRRGRHGGNGARAPEREQRRRARRRAQGGDGIKPSRCALRQPRRAACRELGKSVLIWRKRKAGRSRCRCACPRSCMRPSLRGRRTISAR